MVIGHMRHNGLNARRAVEAILEALSSETAWEGEGKEQIMSGRKWEGAVGVVTSTVKEAVAEVKSRDRRGRVGEEEDGKVEGKGEEEGEGEEKAERTARERLAWLFEGRFTE